jgi:arsenite methyltransferase
MQTPTTLVKEEVQQSSSCCAPSCCGGDSTESETLAVVDSAQRIKEQVKEHYAKVAVESTSCCASSCCGQEPIGSVLYDGDILALVPTEAAASSRGCGNPQEIAALTPGEVVLDLGSGGGLDVLLAARQVGSTGFVYGVDMTDEMLELARRNAAKMGATNVDFLKGHLEDLPLDDNTADVIISNCVVNLSPDKENTLSEAFRVLKPGGRLAISDIVVDGDLSGLPVSEAQIRAGLSWAGCIAGALTVDEFTRLLAEAGFEQIEITFDHHYQAADFFGQIPEELASLPLPVLTDLVQRFGSASIKAKKPV